MAFFKSNTMRIAGITGAIPKNHTDIYELGGPYFDKEFIDTMRNTVGVNNIYICSPEQGSGDLGYAAADSLLDQLDWDRSEVDALIFVSQTLDYVIPPTSTKLQNMLGLSKDTFCLDTNYGCAGFVCGLMLANQMIASGMAKKMLIINAECHRRFISDEDREESLLVGDGASAVAVEKTENGKESFFTTLVDGAHYTDITLGMYKDAEIVNKYGKEYSYMNGENVTQFMLRHIPRVTKSLFEYADVTKDDFDAFLFHQANAHMVKYVSKRMKLDLDKVPLNIETFANTSSASIPLLICDKKPELFKPGTEEKVLMFGFGAGFLLSGAITTLGDLKGGNVVFV